MEYFYIKNEEEYEAVVNRVEHLKDAEPGTADAKELKVLIRMLIHYEKQQLHPQVYSHK